MSRATKPCRYLEGDNIAPLTAAKARTLIGHRVRYLRRSDIDHSGRGYFFPRQGDVVGAKGRNIEIDYPHNFHSFNDMIEIIDLGQSPGPHPDDGVVEFPAGEFPPGRS